MGTSAIEGDLAAARLVADGLMTVAQASAFLRLGRSRVYELMGSGELPSVRIGRSRRIPRRALIDLAARELQRTELGTGQE